MSEVRRLLESVGGQVRAQPGLLEQIYARRVRRERTRRIADGAASIVGTAVVMLAAVGIVGIALSSRIGAPVPEPSTPVINASNIGQLAPAWSIHLEGAGSAAPTNADGALYVTTDDGFIRALDARTGDLRWLARTEVGVTTTPVVSQGIVLVHVAGTLYAFDIACGSEGSMCQPRWTATTGGGEESPVVVAGDMAYVVSSPGGLAAFSLLCDGDPCGPTWVAPDAGIHRAEAPAISEGIVWDSSSHALLAYRTSCAAGGSTCAPLMDPVRPNGSELSSAPTVSDGIVYVGANDGRLYAIPSDCAHGGACEPLWIGRTEGSVTGTPTVVGDVVFVGSNDGSLYAFPRQCGTSGASCGPLWRSKTDGPIVEPAIAANHVVYVSSTDGSLYGFPLACGSDGKGCEPLLQVPIAGDPVAPAVWADRALFIASDGTVTAYTVAGAPL
jgi:outer membrane protein assembly factor BamB